MNEWPTVFASPPVHIPSLRTDLVAFAEYAIEWKGAITRALTASLVSRMFSHAVENGDVGAEDWYDIADEMYPGWVEVWGR